MIRIIEQQMKTERPALLSRSRKLLTKLKETEASFISNVNYYLFRVSGEYDGHLIDEIRLMLPLKEIIEAE